MRGMLDDFPVVDLRRAFGDAPFTLAFCPSKKRVRILMWQHACTAYNKPYV